MEKKKDQHAIFHIYLEPLRKPLNGATWYAETLQCSGLCAFTFVGG